MKYRILFFVMLIAAESDIFATPTCDELSLSNESSMSNVSSVSNSAAATENPLKGMWKKNWIYRIDYDRYLSEPFHYKYYGDNDMISFNIKLDDSNYYNMSFNGKYMSYKYISKDTIEESSSPLRIKTYDDNRFNLFWKNNQLRFEEEWRREDLMPYVVQSWMNACHGKNENKLAGCWKLVSIKHRTKNMNYIMGTVYNYRVYGDGQYLMLIVNGKKQNGDKDNNPVLFSGRLATYNIEGDSIMYEKGIKYTIKWPDENIMERIKIDKDYSVFIETWQREELPVEYLKVIEPLDNSILDTYGRLMRDSHNNVD